MTRRTEKADAIDKHIGEQIRSVRENLGMTQGELAQKVGVSYQQVHKYERGTNRISAGRLGLIANILQQSVQSFYDGFTGHAHVMPDATQESRLCIEMAKHFRQIPNPRYQEALHLLVRILAH